MSYDFLRSHGYAVACYAVALKNIAWLKTSGIVFNFVDSYFFTLFFFKSVWYIKFYIKYKCLILITKIKRTYHQIKIHNFIQKHKNDTSIFENKYLVSFADNMWHNKTGLPLKYTVKSVSFQMQSISNPGRKLARRFLWHTGNHLFKHKEIQFVFDLL